MTSTEQARKRSQSAPDGTEDSNGIVCSNNDLGLILSGRDVVDPQKPGKRRSVTLVQKGMLIRGFLSHDSAVRHELFNSSRRRRISTGSVSIDHGKGANAEGSTRRRPSLMRRFSRRNSDIVSWDPDREFQIDPSVIGNVIEEYLKQDKQADDIKSMARRASSGDLVATGTHQPQQPRPLNNKKCLLVDEMEKRPRKLSLKTTCKPSGLVEPLPVVPDSPDQVSGLEDALQGLTM